MMWVCPVIVNCSQVGNQADFLLPLCSCVVFARLHLLHRTAEIILREFWVELVLLLQGQVLSSDAQEAIEACWEHC